MLFSQAIPEKILESPNSQSFLDVLDRLQMYKTEEISRSLRVFNPLLCNENKWLALMLGDYGVTDIPESYPIAPLQQALLNIEIPRRLCGSKLGVEVLLSVFTLGKVRVDDSKFIRNIKLLYPNDLANGYITRDSAEEHFFLCDDNDVVTGGTSLKVSIETMYYGTSMWDEMEKFIEHLLLRYIGFQDNLSINWTFSTATKPYYHRLLNNYFTE